MNLNDVHRGVHKNKPRKRIGRGAGSGHGKTSGRGHKGQRSRAGYSAHPTFEGGQMPLVRRIPKRGFHNRWAPTVAVVNLQDLQKHFDDGAEVNPQTLKASNLARGRYDLLKVLATGELTKRLTVSAHKFSRQAVQKIQQAGGQIVVLPGKASLAKAKSTVRSPSANDQ
jgi:large subunit ribosomal protein L15